MCLCKSHENPAPDDSPADEDTPHGIHPPSLSPKHCYDGHHYRSGVTAQSKDTCPCVHAFQHYVAVVEIRPPIINAERAQRKGFGYKLVSRSVSQSFQQCGRYLGQFAIYCLDLGGICVVKVCGTRPWNLAELSRHCIALVELPQRFH